MRILLIEDEPTLARQTKTWLQDHDFVVDVAFDGEEGHFLGETEPYDAVVLDLGLPVMDGLSILRRWRTQGHHMPVLILTARDDWTDKVAGLDAGADDYLAKPFKLEELTARIRALIRRANGQANPVLSHNQLEFDTRTGRTLYDGQSITLTAQETKVLSYLLHRKGNVVSKTELTEHIYDQDFDRDSNTIEVFIARLRRKIRPDYIQTRRGQGYVVPN